MEELAQIKLPLLVKTFLDSPGMELIEVHEGESPNFTGLEPSNQTVLIHYVDREDKKYYVVSHFEYVRDPNSDTGRMALKLALTPLYSNDVQYSGEDLCDLFRNYAYGASLIYGETDRSSPATRGIGCGKTPLVKVVTGKVYADYISIANIFKDIKECTIFNLDDKHVYAADLEYDKERNVTTIKCAKATRAVHGDNYAVDIDCLIPDVCSNFEFKMI